MNNYFSSVKNKLFVYLYDQNSRSILITDYLFPNKVAHLSRPNQPNISSSTPNSQWPIATFDLGNLPGVTSSLSSIPYNLNLAIGTSSTFDECGAFIESGKILVSGEICNINTFPILNTTDITKVSGILEIGTSNIVQHPKYNINLAFSLIETNGTLSGTTSLVRLQMHRSYKQDSYNIFEHDWSILLQKTDILEKSVTGNSNWRHIKSTLIDLATPSNMKETLILKRRKYVIGRHVYTFTKRNDEPPMTESTYFYIGNLEIYSGIGKLPLDTDLEPLNIANLGAGFLTVVKAYRSLKGINNADTILVSTKFATFDVAPNPVSGSSALEVKGGIITLMKNLSKVGFLSYQISNKNSNASTEIKYYNCTNESTTIMTNLENQLYFKNSESTVLPANNFNKDLTEHPFFNGILPTHFGSILSGKELKDIQEVVNTKLANFTKLNLLGQLTWLNLYVGQLQLKSKFELADSGKYMKLRKTSNAIKVNGQNIEYDLMFAILLNYQLCIPSISPIQIGSTWDELIYDDPLNSIQSDTFSSESNLFSFTLITNNLLAQSAVHLSLHSSILVAKLDRLHYSEQDISEYKFIRTIINNPYLVFNNFNEGLLYFLLHQSAAFRNFFAETINKHWITYLCLYSSYAERIVLDKSFPKLDYYGKIHPNFGENSVLLYKGSNRKIRSSQFVDGNKLKLSIIPADFAVGSEVKQDHGKKDPITIELVGYLFSNAALSYTYNTTSNLNENYVNAVLWLAKSLGTLLHELAHAYAYIGKIIQDKTGADFDQYNKYNNMFQNRAISTDLSNISDSFYKFVETHKDQNNYLIDSDNSNLDLFDEKHIIKKYGNVDSWSWLSPEENKQVKGLLGYVDYPLKGLQSKTFYLQSLKGKLNTISLSDWNHNYCFDSLVSTGHLPDVIVDILSSFFMSSFTLNLEYEDKVNTDATAPQVSNIDLDLKVIAYSIMLNGYRGTKNHRSNFNFTTNRSFFSDETLSTEHTKLSNVILLILFRIFESNYDALISSAPSIAKKESSKFKIKKAINIYCNFSESRIGMTDLQSSDYTTIYFSTLVSYKNLGIL